MNNISSPVVLMYHGIVSGTSPVLPPDRETGAQLYDISLDNFKAQMKWIDDNGYTPGKSLIITFDDGELNNFRDAFPVLKKFGWKAYFFIIVKRIGKNGYMGWKELKELHEAGMIIGSHGLSHEILTGLLDSQVEEELKASKKNLEINLGIPIDTVSIPRGFCNDKIIETAHSLGYKTVFISDKPAGLRSGCFSRIAIKSGWSLKRFDLALKGQTPLTEIIANEIKKFLKILLRGSGYNWVRGVLIKLIQ